MHDHGSIPNRRTTIDGAENPTAPGSVSLGPLRLLNDVAVAAMEAGSPEEAVRTTLERLCGFMGWPAGHAYVLDEQTATLRPTGIWWTDRPDRFAALRAVSAKTSFKSGEGLPGRVLASGEPSWIEDISDDSNFPRGRGERDVGVRAAFGAPVLVSGGVVAVLEFFGTQPQRPNETLLAVMGTVGAMLGRVYERIRSEARLRESEQRFRSVAENAADAIVTIDAEDRVLFANRATAELFGYSLDEMSSLRFTHLIPPRFRARHRAGMKRYIETGERRIPWDGIELPGLHHDGHEIPLEITFGSFERDGRHIFTGIMRDVRDRKRAEEERTRILERERSAREAAEEARGEAERRARQETALRQAAAAVAGAFTVDDAAQRIAESALVATRADGAFVERVDVEPGRTVVVARAGDAAPDLDTEVPLDRSWTQTTIEREQALYLERLGDSEWQLPGRLGEEYGDYSAAIIPLLDAGGEPVGSLVLLREPGKRSFREDELERALTFGELAGLAFRKIHLLEDSERRREELEKVLESRARLMRGFSHDVRNPLGAADGFLELLEHGIGSADLTDEQQERVARARRSLASALALINDLLDLARAEAGQIEIRIGPTDVREAVRETAEEYRAQAERRSLELTVDVPDTFPVVDSDPGRVRQIAGNLLSNAVKYTPAGGSVIVRVSHVEQSPLPGRRSAVVVHVLDTGPGIPEEKRELLFEEFTRLEGSAASGAGIGLAISRRLARALGGEITLDSTVGAGSTFSFWLPDLRPGEGSDEEWAEEAAVEGA